MQKLINKWRRKARDIAQQINSYSVSCFTTDLEASKSTYLHCARELSRINTFKFCVGDEVIVTNNNHVGMVVERVETLVDGSLDRSYLLTGSDVHYNEQSLQHHRNNQGQTRTRPIRRAK